MPMATYEYACGVHAARRAKRRDARKNNGESKTGLAKIFSKNSLPLRKKQNQKSRNFVTAVTLANHAPTAIAIK